MKLRLTMGFSFAALVSVGTAMADPLPGQVSVAGDKTAPDRQVRTGDTIVQIAAVTEQIAQVAAATAVVAPQATETAGSVPPPATGQPQTAPIKSKTAATKPRPGKHQLAAKPDKAIRAAPRRRELAAADPKPMLVRGVGVRQLGNAAWYGGRYVGRRTSSGETLDSIHPTAAHRTLPLNSLARVTNLQNGRSVIVRVTDRGPVSTALLIDVSPDAADQLDMKNAGVVPVVVEQVVAVPPDAR